MVWSKIKRKKTCTTCEKTETTVATKSGGVGISRVQTYLTPPAMIPAPNIVCVYFSLRSQSSSLPNCQVRDSCKLTSMHNECAEVRNQHLGHCIYGHQSRQTAPLANSGTRFIKCKSMDHELMLVWIGRKAVRQVLG